MMISPLINSQTIAESEKYMVKTIKPPKKEEDIMDNDEASIEIEDEEEKLMIAISKVTYISWSLISTLLILFLIMKLKFCYLNYLYLIVN